MYVHLFFLVRCPCHPPPPPKGKLPTVRQKVGCILVTIQKPMWQIVDHYQQSRLFQKIIVNIPSVWRALSKAAHVTVLHRYLLTSAINIILVDEVIFLYTFFCKGEVYSGPSDITHETWSYNNSNKGALSCQDLQELIEN